MLHALTGVITTLVAIASLTDQFQIVFARWEPNIPEIWRL